jgi:hypothetical protein
MFATLFGGPFVERFDRGGRLGSRRQDLDPRGVRLREEGGRVVPAEGLLPTRMRSSTTTVTRKAAWTPGARRRTAVGGGARHRLAASAALPADEKTRALYAERSQIERRIESLKLLKSGMDPAKYESELEKLATELALKTRQIRAAEGGK